MRTNLLIRRLTGSVERFPGHSITFIGFVTLAGVVVSCGGVKSSSVDMEAGG